MILTNASMAELSKLLETISLLMDLDFERKNSNRNKTIRMTSAVTTEQDKTKIALVVSVLC